ncbi:hypothetical protein C8F01DRAFT_331071 [Mycena amicta]|nr:hypothetical protein C8F01DRAFT_331071 [Mycena amicta]
MTSPAEFRVETPLHRSSHAYSTPHATAANHWPDANVSPRDVVCGGLTSAESDHSIFRTPLSPTPTIRAILPRSPPPTSTFTQITMLYSTRVIVPVNGFLPYGGRRVRVTSSTNSPPSPQTQTWRHISIVEQLALMVTPRSRLQAVPLTRSHPLLRDSYESKSGLGAVPLQSCDANRPY